ncbi:MAG: hypothetical protein AAF603_06215 [Pseudomonadota bacterium]
MSKLRVIYIILIIFFVTACTSNSSECFQTTEDGLTTWECPANLNAVCKTSTGEIIDADTALLWAWKTGQYNVGIQKEKADKTDSTSSYSAIRRALNSFENGDRYARYIISRRQKIGLPELQELPENWRQMGKKCATPHRDQLRYPYPTFYYKIDELGWPQTQTVHSD